MNIVILGPQGSGKGTQASLLSKYLNIPTFSTGKKLREISTDKNHKLYSVIKKSMDKGELVSNVIVNKILNEAVEEALKNHGGIIIDGTPRKYDQLVDLEEVLSLYNQKIDLAIFLDVSDEESKTRLLKRAEIEHRADDTKQAIIKRLQIYHEQTEPILKEFDNKGVLVKVDGDRAIEDIQKDIRSIVSKNS